LIFLWEYRKIIKKITSMIVATSAVISEINLYSSLLTLLIRDKLFMKPGLHKSSIFVQA